MPVVAAAAVVDPNWAVELLNRCPDSLAYPGRRRVEKKHQTEDEEIVAQKFGNRARTDHENPAGQAGIEEDADAGYDLPMRRAVITPSPQVDGAANTTALGRRSGFPA